MGLPATGAQTDVCDCSHDWATHLEDTFLPSAVTGGVHGDGNGEHATALTDIPVLADRPLPSELNELAVASRHAGAAPLVFELDFPLPLPFAAIDCTRAYSSGVSPCLYGQLGIRVHSRPSANA